MIHDYFADCKNTECPFQELRSERLICPLCGDKVSLFPMIEFGGLSVVYDGQRFFLSNAISGLNKINTEMDTADVMESLEFMTFFHNGKKHRERIIDKVLQIVELELKNIGVIIDVNDFNGRIHNYLRDCPSR